MRRPVRPARQFSALANHRLRIGPGVRRLPLYAAPKGFSPRIVGHFPPLAKSAVRQHALARCA